MAIHANHIDMVKFEDQNASSGYRDVLYHIKRIAKGSRTPWKEQLLGGSSFPESQLTVGPAESQLQKQLSWDPVAVGRVPWAEDAVLHRDEQVMAIKSSSMR